MYEWMYRILGGLSLIEFARVFKAMGDESRLRIIVALGKKRYGVCDLAKCLGLSQPTLSHHLKILRETGLVKGEKEGQSTCCSLNLEAFDRFGIDINKLMNHGEDAPGSL